MDKPVNCDKEPIRVFHSNLARETEQSIYKSSCPVCELGILLVVRDQKTLELLAEDRCMLCGQAFVYEDIEKMRKRQRRARGIQD